MKLKKRIDDVYYQIGRHHQYIAVIGWLIFDERVNYFCKINGKLTNTTCEVINRKDVVERYSKLTSNEECGFMLKTKCPMDEFIDTFEIYASVNDENILLFKCKNKYLLRHKSFLEEMNGFYYVLDNKIIGENVISLDGWALTTISNDKIQYNLFDENKNEVDFEFKQTNRIDAYKLYKCKNGNVMCGFRIKFNYDMGKKYFLTISTEEETKKIELSPKKIKKQNEYANKKHIKFSKLMKFVHPKKIYKGLVSVRNKGLRRTLEEIKKKTETSDEIDYEKWFSNHKASKEELNKQKKYKFNYEPKISIIVPTYKTPEKFLKEMVDSVIGQTYSNWELCIGDGSKDDDTVENTLKKNYANESRVKFNILDDNLGISGNTNAALELATGEYIALLDHDDLLAPEALYEIVKRINETNAEVVYTDEDKISMDLKTHFQPHFKPDFNLDLLRSNNYICHFFVVKRSIVDIVGGFRSEHDGSQDYDFIFRCTHAANKVEHIPRILYYWRMHQNSVAENPQSKMYAFDAGKRAIEENLRVCGLDGEVSHTDYLGFYRVKYAIKGEPKISIVIPNKDEKNTLKKCVDSIIEKSTYTNYEIIIVENNSTTKEIFDYYKEIEKINNIKVVNWQDEFNYSAINNFGVKNSDGDYLILLNNDVEVITHNWIEEMLGICQREDVGIVGAKLLYPDDTVQHAGVVVGIGGIAGHVMNGIGRYDTGYFAKALIQQDLSAVTAACLMIKRNIYMEVGQLEEQLKVAFNDVDFCLKVRQHNYLIVFDPFVELYHYESKSRGTENTIEKMKRFENEIEYMEKKWKDILENGDPYYNPNFSLEPGGYQLKRNFR